jgi:hypothetical protein
MAVQQGSKGGFVMSAVETLEQTAVAKLLIHSGRSSTANVAEDSVQLVARHAGKPRRSECRLKSTAQIAAAVW